MTTQSTTIQETPVQKYQRLGDVATQVVQKFTANRLTREYHKYFKTILGTFLSVPDHEKENLIPLFFKSTESLFQLLQSSLPHTFGTYLQGSFSLDKFVSIKNDAIKPIGGLWGCPLEQRNGEGYTAWYDFNELNNSLDRIEGRKFYKFMLQSEANVFVVNCQIDLFVLFRLYGAHMDLMQQICVEANLPIMDHYLNFEKISSDFDAILVTENAIRELSYPQIGKMFNLYSWDLESLLVLNPKAMGRPWI